MSQAVVASIIDKFGGQVPMAAATGVDQSTIAHWKRRGIIPARQQQKILDAARRLGIAISPADFFDADHQAA